MVHIPGQTLLLASIAGAVIDRLGFLFEKPPAETRIVCIPTAANVYEKKEWFENERDAFRAQGFRLTDFDLDGKDQSAVAAGLKEAEIVYVTGGNSYYLQEKINQSGFADVVRDRLRAGAMYIGSSAGAVVACPTVDFIRDMDDVGKATLTHFKGMGLIDFLVLPHVDHKSCRARAQEIAREAEPYQRMIGLRDDQALVVRGAYAEIF